MVSATLGGKPKVRSISARASGSAHRVGGSRLLIKTASAVATSAHGSLLPPFAPAREANGGARDPGDIEGSWVTAERPAALDEIFRLELKIGSTGSVCERLALGAVA